MKKVTLHNIEPAWVEYEFEVEVPDDTPEDELESAAIAQIGEPGTRTVYGPEVKGQIDGMDQEWSVRNVE